MSKAKKLPSGSWRCLAYSHTEKVLNPKTGKMKDKRIYESFTCDDPSPRGRREAELAAAEFQMNKSQKKRQTHQFDEMLLSEAIDKYIDSRESISRSPSTIADYRGIKKNAFPDLMEMKLKDINISYLQEAINTEASRPSKNRTRNPKPISPKRLHNEWGLIRATLRKYKKELDFDEIELPTVIPRSVELPSAASILKIIRGTEIELAVLLAMWLSFSMSEVRGLTKSKSLSPDGNYITIREVLIEVNKESIRKDLAKNPTRNRRHRIPTYIKLLIDQVEGDVIVPMKKKALYDKWIKLQNDNHMEHITFHDLRHMNASVMALLRIPEKYAMERGGWKTDKVMKRVYTHTFAEERVHVDDTIDKYFEEIMQHEMQHEKEKA